MNNIIISVNEAKMAANLSIEQIKSCINIKLSQKKWSEECYKALYSYKNDTIFILEQAKIFEADKVTNLLQKLLDTKMEQGKLGTNLITKQQEYKNTQDIVVATKIKITEANNAVSAKQKPYDSAKDTIGRAQDKVKSFEQSRISNENVLKNASVKLKEAQTKQENAKINTATKQGEYQSVKDIIATIKMQLTTAEAEILAKQGELKASNLDYDRSKAEKAFELDQKALDEYKVYDPFSNTYYFRKNIFLEITLNSLPEDSCWRTSPEFDKPCKERKEKKIEDLKKEMKNIGLTPSNIPDKAKDVILKDNHKKYIKSLLDKEMAEKNQLENNLNHYKNQEIQIKAVLDAAIHSKNQADADVNMCQGQKNQADRNLQDNTNLKNQAEADLRTYQNQEVQAKSALDIALSARSQPEDNLKTHQAQETHIKAVLKALDLEKNELDIGINNYENEQKAAIQELNLINEMLVKIPVIVAEEVNRKKMASKGAYNAANIGEVDEIYVLQEADNAVNPYAEL